MKNSPYTLSNLIKNNVHYLKVKGYHLKNECTTQIKLYGVNRYVYKTIGIMHTKATTEQVFLKT